MKTLEMEVVLMDWLKANPNIVVPNVSWGLGLHECDLLRVTPSNWATEVEIKISKADLIKDKEKTHGHYSNKIKYLYFAVPAKLEDIALKEMPKRAGLLVCGKDNVTVQEIRKPTLNKNARKLTDKEVEKLKYLGCLRILSMKRSQLRRSMRRVNNVR